MASRGNMGGFRARPAGESDDDSDSYGSYDDYYGDEYDRDFEWRIEEPPQETMPYIFPQLVHQYILPDSRLPSRSTRTLLNLRTACEEGDLEEVKKALADLGEGGVDVRLPNSLTPLMVATLHGRKEIVDHLLAVGAYPKSRSYLYGTPLHCAIVSPETSSRMGCVKSLVDKDETLLKETDKSGYTPFLLAAELGDLEMVIYLRMRGADVKAVGTKSRDAFEIACANGHEPLLEYFSKENLMKTDRASVDMYLRTAKSSGFRKVAEKYVKVETEGEVVVEPEGGEAGVEIETEDDGKYKLLENPCPSKDVEVSNPLTATHTGKFSRVNCTVRDVLSGLDQCVGCDRLLLEPKFVAHDKTRLHDLFSLNERTLDEMGVSEIGHRIALMDLPFVSLKFPFDYEEIELDDGEPSDFEQDMFRQFWAKRKYGRKGNLEKDLAMTLKVYGREWDIVHAEAAFWNLSVYASIMAAHFKVLSAHENDDKVFIKPSSDMGERLKLQIECLAFAYREAIRTRDCVSGIVRSIDEAISNDLSISPDFENQKIVFLSTPFSRFCVFVVKASPVVAGVGVAAYYALRTIKHLWGKGLNLRFK